MNIKLVIRIIINLFFLIIIGNSIYKKYFKPMTSAADYIDRASRVRNKRKAIEILEEALENTDINYIEKPGILISIGMYHYELKNYISATKYFDKTFDIILDKDFYFTKRFIDIIKCYVYAGQKDKGIKLYNNLLNRQDYDRKFKKLKKLEKFLENC